MKANFILIVFTLILLSAGSVESNEAAAPIAKPDVIRPPSGRLAIVADGNSPHL